MKLYIISGLGADFSVLEKLKFPDHVEPVFIPWLIPERNESFSHYIQRMASSIEENEDFALLGYSFGGFIVQEIHQIKPAKKVIILGSLKSDLEKSRLMRFGKITQLPRRMPTAFFSDQSTLVYRFIRAIVAPKSPKLMQYFKVTHPYYIKWSMDKIVNWKFPKQPEVVQIMGDRDWVFPLQNSQPDYIIKDGTHLFPLTKAKETSEILKKIL
ncbi:alpha/beta hydrolase [Riemerella columbina]|uniref:alpha/beta hydrolase n=1 Tax=Riemerella columbina TaxID=103810 RepID=UPI00266FE893|nr:alpha/beta hydrolase [Riemerella columbina]WKS94327.1 alpha/beta hydrolase [Riemerella columbina]